MNTVSNTQRNLDFLSLTEKIGRLKSFVVYSLLIFALFNLVAALVLILIPINDPDMKNNTQMIFAKRAWVKEQELQKNLIENKIILQINDQNGKLSNSLKVNNKQLAPFNLISQVVPLQSSDYFGNIQISHQWNYSSNSQNLSFNFYVNEINDENKLINSQDQNSQMTLQTILQTEFNMVDMIAQGMCFDITSCVENCIKNKNEIVQNENREKVCRGLFQVNSVCAVMDFSDKKIIGGCYKNGQYEKYSFIKTSQDTKKQIVHQNMKVRDSVDINFEIYDKQDPHIKALELSQTYEPYEQTVSPYQKASKYFFLIGGSISVAILFILALINASHNKEKGDEKEENKLNQTQEMVLDPTSITQMN
ncbi:transmembrane protein, putative (macronuclear) [Tetrahymena thermophila SB210]|uniref:Transmembrane protein, putative n=1 Tax=Tetrahymena thermophila (strain SB210) TaxID=312017 RepID=Q240J0_TETTS|nr:transmembrane protein, putative [Tetrahymena thermophila SB210]EAS02218.1 transmembrane protein, putative [Tetrahymena thermophila SB210]|eukprot:XP_001022463.1 transmembrane protein, putative [Tetrahymena thermophila SB210]